MVDLELSVLSRSFPGGLDGKESACSAGELGSSLDREDPWRREWQLNPVFLPAESHGQRRLEGYNPCGYKQSDMSEG